MQLVYMYAHSACMQGRRSLLGLMTAFLFVAALACAAWCFSYRRHWSEFPDQSDRIRFLAFLGTVTGLLCAVVIAAQGIATLMLDPCAT